MICRAHDAKIVMELFNFLAKLNLHQEGVVGVNTHMGLFELSLGEAFE